MAHIYNSQLDAFSLYHKVAEEKEEETRLTLSSLTPALPALGEALSGATGTALSNLLVYPLDLVITRLQVQNRQAQNNQHNESTSGSKRKQSPDNASLISTSRQIYTHEGGLRAFYSGVTADTLKSITDSFLFFLAYTFFRRTRQRQRRGALSIAEELGVGMLAGAFARFWTTPIQNVVVRMQCAALRRTKQSPNITPDLEKGKQKAEDISDVSQTSQPTPPHPNKPTAPSVSQTTREIYQQSGLPGFWAGYSASLILTLNPAITFLLHSLFSRTLLRLQRLKHRSSNSSAPVGPQLTFLVAALSKAIASIATYPLALAKARAQAGSEGHEERSRKYVSPYASYEGWHERSHGSKGPAVEMLVPAVLRTVVRIAETEGLGALYAGLGGEVVKGFLGHGGTMVLKQRVHISVLWLWGLLARKMKSRSG
ncbi:MAG: hypothetical protein M1820_008658 [Bogoriella megaspora]|nr:MAG: hypothetical protein M1820_008658 [Bogoriella megaspora]